MRRGGTGSGRSASPSPRSPARALLAARAACGDPRQVPCISTPTRGQACSPPSVWRRCAARPVRAGLCPRGDRIPVAHPSVRLHRRCRPAATWRPDRPRPRHDRAIINPPSSKMRGTSPGPALPTGPVDLPGYAGRHDAHDPGGIRRSRLDHIVRDPLAHPRGYSWPACGRVRCPLPRYLHPRCDPGR